jgi:hypothetical protein
MMYGRAIGVIDMVLALGGNLFRIHWNENDTFWYAEDHIELAQ